MSERPDDVIHDKVDAFADGELPPAEAEEFRAHLATCAQCQAELRDIMLLAATTAPLATPAAAATTAAATRPSEPRRAGGARSVRRRRVLIVAVSTMSVAAALVVAWRLRKPEPIVLAQADRRPLEPRLSDASADRWRPYDVERAGGVAREEVRVDTLAALERRGDWRGLGDAYLLSGELDRAAETLARAGESADVESDRAAAALQAHDAATALADATHALALSPGHPQAAWNRALALRDLGLVRTAAVAFDGVARHGERGWSDEALKRGMALRTAWQTRERSRQEAELAGRALVEHGTQPPPEPVRAWPELIEHYRALAAHDAKKDPFVALADAERDARKALQAGDAATAAKLAQAGLERARAAGADPRDFVRRFYLVLADAARAQGHGAIADAYVDEARTLVPGGD